VSRRLPTLLVGLGGTGCRIVDRVLGRARNAGMDRDHRIEFVGFDTDVTDISKLKHLDGNHVFQISDNKTVYQVATKHGPAIADWMVPIDRLPVQVRTQTLDKGAGQLRFLTRLALYDRFADRSFEPRVRTAIGRLARHDGRDPFQGTMNVFVVGSLAGGTGSGSFLPITLLIESILRESGANPSVNGFFLLGDIFVNTGKVPVRQLPNVQANTYAALAELHAINSAVGPHGDIAALGYEYLPGRRLIRDGRPFRDLTLIDFENQNGGNLGKEIDHYEKLAARALFTQIFTAVGGARDSIVVNDLIDRTSPVARHDVRLAIAGSQSGADLTKLVSSAGVYAIEYPREDILNYLSVRFARENLTSEWLLLDERFQDRLNRYNEERRAGNFRASEPVRNNAYLEDFLQIAREGVPFFAEIMLNLEPEADIQTGRRPKPQIQTFVDALESRMVDMFWDAAPDLRSIRNQRQELAPENLGDAASGPETVQNHETRLDLDWRTIVDAVRDRPDALFSVILSNSLTLRPGEWRPYHIQNFVLANEPHLVQVRYFLYAARAEIEKRSRDKKVDTDRIREDLFGLTTTWDPDRDPKTATERGARAKLLAAARAAAQGGVLGFVRGGDFKRFQQNFAGYYNDTIQKMREWAEASVKRRTYERMRNELDLMIRVVEGMFAEVRRLSDRLTREEADALEAHNPLTNTVQSGTLFVCADRTCKEALWSRLKHESAGRRIGKEANHALAEAFLSAYQNARTDEHRRLPAFERILHDTIVRDFAAKLIENVYHVIYKVPLAEAIEREAKIRETEWLTTLQDLVRRTRDFARPFLTLARDDAGQPITFWAMNPKLFAYFASTHDFENTFATEQGVRTLVEDEFPDTELVCFAMRGNLTVDDIAKINPGPQGVAAAGDVREGPYHAAYRERVETLLAFEFDKPHGIYEGVMMTPHVAKDWHKPGRLTPIFESVRQEQERRLQNAYVVAQSLPGLLDRLNVEGLGEVTYLDLSNLITRRGDRYLLVRSQDNWQIYQALADHVEFVDPILTVWHEWLGGYSGAAEASPVADAAVTERLLTLALKQVDGDARRRVVPGLVRAQIAIIGDVVEQRHPAEAYHARMQRRLNIIMALGQSTFDKLSPHVSADILRNLQATFNQEVAATRGQRN
jgi:hypothetical protein